MPAAALAQDADQPLGQPHDWQIGMQAALSPVQHQMVWFNDYVLFFIIPITALVAGLLGWCIYRYSAARNPVPSRTSHNTVIEVIWTVAPILVLLCIAFPSFQILTAQYNPPSDPELTIKATGYQWYWGYEYQPVGQDPANEAQNVSFDSYMLHEEDRADSGKTDMRTYPRLLAVDNELVLPVGTVIRVITTGADVIHSWAMPSLGVKVDAVPGRLNEYWFSIDKPGLFYGQCSELCGKDHAFMPIAVRAVEKDQFQRWLAAAGTSVDDANKQLNAELDSAKRVALAGR
ncbi:cytochrome c oxidase subunit II [Aurantimonas sp. MSK8Z-1]|uniref:cytochrome c oxidase subunit II n=1 Tax=Mangrovibrevibacter kandeliae TaxID=2968473 RepID=UPI0021183995|nr:cytochrome c oxidase subunit II [Aurantimonas sp. MSK8Z-1]MCW4113508.1 cytochrome c oxidase subunit II [Aurantimonas sp. MSK8Z-1]